MTTKPQFDRYIGIDYSGAKTPTSSLQGLRVYAATRDSAPVEVDPPPSPRRYWTRRGIAEWLVERLREDEAILVGIDHGFSFPREYFDRHALAFDWRAFLDDFCLHWPTDEDDTSVDDVRHGKAGRAQVRSGDARWRRLAEVWASAKSVFHFDVQGSVAKSTHAGLPWLRYIRGMVGDRVHFWPFDGWEVPSGRSAVVEVYPSLWRGLPYPREGRSDDQQNAFSAAEWMRRADSDGSLQASLNPRLEAVDRERAAFEGWILGVTESRSFRPRHRGTEPEHREALPVKGMEAEVGSREQDAFPPGVAEKLKTYVYRLIDPRNGETFYVGKGKGNRVFAHIRLEGQLDGDDSDNKVKRIRDIQLAGFEVAHVIHRHGMEDETAIEVEAALIQAYPGLTNIAGGAGNNDYGVMHAREVINRYCAEEAVFRHKAMLINVNISALETSLYEATRYAWKVSRAKAKLAEVILPTRHGVIRDAFVADDWLEATSTNFPGREDVPGRLGFVGREAPAEIKRLYVGKRVPDRFRKKGAANPIKYTWE